MKFNEFIRDRRGVFGLNAIQQFFIVILGIAILAFVIVVIMGTLGGTTILNLYSATYTNDSVAKANTAGVALTANGLSNPTCGALTAVYNTPTASTLVANETGFINKTGYTLATSSLYYGYASPTIALIINASNNVVIASGNWTLTGNTITNASDEAWNAVKITYTYAITGKAISLGNFSQANCIITNTSSTSTYSTNLLYNYPYTYNSIQQDNLNSLLVNTSTGITGFFSSISPIYAILAILVIILILVVLVRVVQMKESSVGMEGQL